MANTEKTDFTHFKLNIDKDLHEKLKKIAAHEDRSMTAQINRMLREQADAYDLPRTDYENACKQCGPTCSC